MKATIKQEIEVDLKTMHVEAGVRHWEDATINGVVDEKGDLIPCREGDRWKPVIELETGKIRNWRPGTKVEIHFKVFDNCSFHFEDEKDNRYLVHENEYVPEILCPAEPGFGDYIIMNIDENGIIEDWSAADLSELAQG